MSDNEVALQTEIYDYGKAIKNTNEMGIGDTADLDQLKTNVSGLSQYTKILTTGKSSALKTNGFPLGNNYFMYTGVKCNPKENPKNEVKLYTYVANAPSGSNSGLITSIIKDVVKLNPLALMSSTKSQMNNNKCIQVELPHITQNENGSHNLKYLKKHIGVNELNDMTSYLCSTAYKSEILKRNPNKIKCNEGFKIMNDYLNNDNDDDINKYKLNTNNTNISAIYHASISLMLIYVLYKLIK